MSLLSYKEAKQLATKKNAGIIYFGDAGNGCKFEVYYCLRRNSQIWTTITKDGFRIVN